MIVSDNQGQAKIYTEGGEINSIKMNVVFSVAISIYNYST